MKLHYDRDTDALYIKLSDSPSTESSEVAPDIVLDFDAEGRLVGIDMDHASRHVDITSLEALGLHFRSITAL
jgi:uncharacterized protein YuzE